MTDKFCVKQRALFSDRLDGQPLPFWRGLLVRLHLRVCPACIRYDRSLAATRDALRALGGTDPPPRTGR
jgi:predicted anti-sigma-YlaC factor YlaD